MSAYKSIIMQIHPQNIQRHLPRLPTTPMIIP